MRDKICAYSIKYQGDWNKIANAIKNNEPIYNVKCSYNFVTVVDENYPNKLKRLRYPPWILFYEGDLSLCEKKSIGIVGSRKASSYGIMCTKKICDTVCATHVIISGLAKGIDAYAHRFSMTHNTIGVLGCGINITYPYENVELYEVMKKKQCIISEYPPDVPPRKHHFPWRNRIVAALSDKIAIPQAKIKSGTAITVSYALELSKEIYVIPYPLDNKEGDGCNELIYNGGNILIYMDDLI